MPQPEEIYRLVADQHAALARLVASAHALADAPIWLVGAGPIIDAALAAAPQRGRGPVSGVVVTSVTSSSGSCSESVLYSDPGTGAGPEDRGQEVRRLRSGFARRHRAPTDRPSGTAGSSARCASYHRGVGRAERPAAIRSSAALSPADQNLAVELTAETLAVDPHRRTRSRRLI